MKKFAHLTKKAEKRKSAPEPVAKKKPTSNWGEKIEKMREEFPNAYKSWEKADDETLKQDFQNGVDIKEMSKKFGRHPGSIRARLKKHFGEEVILG